MWSSINSVSHIIGTHIDYLLVLITAEPHKCPLCEFQTNYVAELIINTTKVHIDEIPKFLSMMPTPIERLVSFLIDHSHIYKGSFLQ